MRQVLPSASLERALAVLVALTIIAFAAGSSSIPELAAPAHSARWVVLFVLLGAAVVATASNPRGARPGPVHGLAVALAGLALASTGWSSDPRLTVERTVSFAVLLSAAAVVAWAVARRPSVALGGVLGGAAAVALAGLVLAGLDRDAAVNPATEEQPARFKGLGENPNTASLLLALALPLALRLCLEGRPARRIGGVALFVLLFGSIAASGSRGSLAGAFVGTATLAALVDWRAARRLALLVVLAALFAVGLLLAQIPQPLPAMAGPAQTSGSATRVDDRPGWPGSLDDELGRGASTRRTLTGSTGRRCTWEEALRADARPLLGYGFGTEDRVFVDRCYGYQGDRPSNSWLGLYLQLGLVGLALLVAVAVSTARGAARALSSRGGPARLNVAAAAGVGAAAIPPSVVESWLYAAGSIGAAALWIAVFTLGTRPVEAHAGR